MDRLKIIRTQWDRVAAWVAVGAGALALLVGWLGVSDSVIAAEQLPYIISGGLGGIALIAVGLTLWLSADIRDEWTELHALVTRLDDRADKSGAPSTATEVVTTGRRRPIKVAN